MRLGNRFTSVAGAAVAVLLLNVAVAYGETCEAASFEDFTDAVAGRFFDADATATQANDPAYPNRLIIRFNTGRDPATWRANDFRASTAAFSHLSAMDTISFRVVPPAGCYVSKVTYKQDGSGTIYRTGIVRGGSNWVVGDYAADLGTFGTSPNVWATVDLTDVYLTMVPVSITTGVHAFATPQLGSATVSITGAQVLVELTALPAPVADEPLPVVEEPTPPAEEPPPPADDPAPPPPTVE